MKQVIVTGPTGVLGMALIKYLSNENIRVIAVVREGSSRIKQIKESNNVTVVECSLSEMPELPQRVLRAVRKKKWNEVQLADVFYHFAWDGTSEKYRNDMYLQNQNIYNTLNAVIVAKELGCTTFIGAGSQAEYGRYRGKLDEKVPTFPDNGYGMAKLCAGQMTRVLCEQKGIKHIWLRILSVYGPYDGDKTMIMSSINNLLNGKRVSCTKGEQIWDYLYSMDAAKMLHLLGDYGISGKTYCLGSGTARPLREYIETIRDMVNPNAEIGFGDIEYSPKQVMHLCADISELIDDTGYQSEYDFDKGIKETIDWYKKYNYEKKEGFMNTTADIRGGGIATEINM